MNCVVSYDFIMYLEYVISKITPCHCKCIPYLDTSISVYLLQHDHCYVLFCVIMEFSENELLKIICIYYFHYSIQVFFS